MAWIARRVVDDEEAAKIYPSLTGRPIACLINYGKHDWVLRKATDPGLPGLGTIWVCCARCGLEDPAALTSEDTDGT